MERMKGVVRWWSEARGHGFIRGSGETDYFVHHTGVRMNGRKNLVQDEEVDFEPVETVKGWRAVEVMRRG